MEQPSSVAAQKARVLRHLLETHTSAYVWIDSRKAVAVPADLKGRPQLILQLGYHMPVPIPDIEIDESGWSATLTFNRRPFMCVIPWEAVYVMVGENTGKGAWWPGDKPPDVDLDENPVDRAQAEAAPPREGRKKKLPPGWKVIPGGG